MPISKIYYRPDRVKAWSSKLAAGSRREPFEAVVWLWIGEAQTVSHLMLREGHCCRRQEAKNTEIKVIKRTRSRDSEVSKACRLHRERAEEVAKHRGNRQF